MLWVLKIKNTRTQILRVSFTGSETLNSFPEQQVSDLLLDNSGQDWGYRYRTAVNHQGYQSPIGTGVTLAQHHP